MNRLVLLLYLRGCKVANASPLAVLHGRKVKNPSPLDVLRGSEVANPSPSDVLHVCKVTNPRALATLRRSIAPPRGLSPFARLQNASEGSPALLHGCKMPPRGLSPFCTGLFFMERGAEHFAVAEAPPSLFFSASTDQRTVPWSMLPIPSPCIRSCPNWR